MHSEQAVYGTRYYRNPQKPNTNKSSPIWITYVANFQLILKINNHKLILLIRTVLILTNVQEPYQTPIAKFRGYYNPASKDLQIFQVSLRVKNTQNKTVNKNSNSEIAD